MKITTTYTVLGRVTHQYCRSRPNPFILYVTARSEKHARHKVNRAKQHVALVIEEGRIERKKMLSETLPYFEKLGLAIPKSKVKYQPIGF
jgi:hypothetical protein